MMLSQVEPILTLLGASPSVLSRVFHRVNDVLPEDQDVKSIPYNTPVSRALAIMKERKFSQIPVQAGAEVLGVFSYRSFAMRIPEHSGDIEDLSQLPVGEFIEHPDYVQVLDDMAQTLDPLARQDMVLVGSRDDLKGLITPIDMVLHLYKLSKPFLLLGEVELGLRNIISNCTSEVQLQELITLTLSSKYQPEKMPRSLEEMSFNDYVQIIGYSKAWKYFEGAFGQGERQRTTTLARLGELRKLRNDIFHFKRNLEKSDVNTLEVCREWIKNVAIAYQALRSGE